jgi:hypothetical protein
MEHIDEWVVRVYLFEHDDHTSARAVLTIGANTLQTEGRAQVNPPDIAVPEINDELAAGRALARLAGQLLRAGEVDIEALIKSRPIDPVTR